MDACRESKILKPHPLIERIEEITPKLGGLPNALRLSLSRLLKDFRTYIETHQAARSKAGKAPRSSSGRPPRKIPPAVILVLQSIKAGEITANAAAVKLRADGFPVTGPTLTRWVAERLE